MTALLEFRERLRQLYAKQGRVVNGLAKGLLMLLVLVYMNATIGYNQLLLSPVICLFIALVAMVLPHAVSLSMVLGIIGVEMYAVGLEVFGIYGCVCLVFLLLYFIFKPEKSYVMTLSILLGMAQFYGVLPMVVGLLFAPICIVPLCFGVIISHFTTYVSLNYSVLTKASGLDAVQKLLQVLKGVFLDENLWILLFLCIGVTLLVYIIRRMSFRNSWWVAIFVGCFCTFLLNIIFSVVMDTNENYVVLIINVVLEAVTGIVLLFFFFMVDYSREEVVQFEDDEYYYYVKAIPKLGVAMRDMKVTKIRESHIKEVVRSTEQVTFIKEKEDTMEPMERPLPPGLEMVSMGEKETIHPDTSEGEEE